MASFGPKVAAAAGIAASYSVRHEGDKFGGNGPLFASGLHGLWSGGIDVTYIGAMGRDEVLPVYREAIGGRTKRLVTLADPPIATASNSATAKSCFVVCVRAPRSLSPACWNAPDPPPLTTNCAKPGLSPQSTGASWSMSEKSGATWRTVSLNSVAPRRTPCFSWTSPNLNTAPRPTSRTCSPAWARSPASAARS